MARECTPIDVSRLTELADEVRKTRRPRTVTINADVVAVLKPAKPARLRARREPTAEDIAAFEAAAGGWKDVDVDRFLRDNAESRRRSSRRPVEL